MKKNEQTDSQKGKLYISSDRYKEQKKNLKSSGCDCRDERMAEIVAVEKRTFQNYIAGRRPIPKDCLDKLCQYMNVSPDWLTKKTNEYATLTGEDSKEWKESLIDFRLKNILIEYLYQAGITEGRSMKVRGIGLTMDEYMLLMNHLQAVIDSTTDCFIKNALSCRKMYNATIIK